MADPRRACHLQQSPPSRRMADRARGRRNRQRCKQRHAASLRRPFWKCGDCPTFDRQRSRRQRPRSRRPHSALCDNLLSRRKGRFRRQSASRKIRPTRIFAPRKKPTFPTNTSSKTPLARAIYMKEAKMVELLKKYGAAQIGPIMPLKIRIKACRAGQETGCHWHLASASRFYSQGLIFRPTFLASEILKMPAILD